MIEQVLLSAKQRDFQDLFLTGDERPYGYAAKTLVDDFGSTVSDAAMREFLRNLFKNREDIHWVSSLKDLGSYVFTCTGPWGRARIHVANINDAAGIGSRLGFSVRFLLEKPIALTDLDVPFPTEFLTRRTGLILISGITGDGKSTFAASLCDWFSRVHGQRCLSIGHPIEYLSTTPLWWQREVLHHTKSYVTGTEDAQQQYPRLIDISELKTRAVADGMFYAAESGHLTIATIHSDQPSAAPERLAALYDSPRFPLFMLSTTGIVLVGVRLARVTGEYAEKTGRKLRAICEVIPFTTAIRNAVRTGSPAHELRGHVMNPVDKTAAFMTFERHAAMLGPKVIAKDEALSVVPDPELYARELAKLKVA